MVGDVEFLLQVAGALGQAASLGEAAVAALAPLTTRLGLDAGRLLLLDGGGTLRPIAAFARSPAPGAAEGLDVAGLLEGLPLAGSVELLALDAAGRPWEALRRAGIGLAVTAPLRFGASLRGLFLLTGREARALARGELRLIELTAALASGAIAAAARAEEAARRAGELRAVVEAIPEGVAVLDGAGRVRWSNDAAERLLGISITGSGLAPETIALLAVRRLDGVPFDPAGSAIAGALAGQAGSDVVVFTRPRTGEEVVVRLTSTPLRAARGELVGAALVASDISKEHALGRLKDDFLSLTAHELRNPLAGMKAQTQLVLSRLRVGRLGHDRLVTALGTLEQEVDRLTAICAELLDLSRLESGQLALEPARFDLRAEVAGVLARAGLTTSRHKLVLAGAEGPVPALADRDRVVQIVHNLLANALRYSPGGGRVFVRVERRRDEVTLVMADEGVGIAPEDLPRIFDRYARVRGAPPGPTAGSGLGVGLHYARELATRMGGRLEARSDGIGRGAELTLTLPAGG